MNRIYFLLVFLGIIMGSIFLKLYSLDLEIPLYKDNLDLTLRAFAHLGGNFEMSANRNFGWSLFQSPFLLLIDTENFLDYSKLVRLLGVGVSISSIFVMYLLSRKFFNEKYSLVSTSLFAFYPQVNQISGLGQTEPLFTISLMLSFLFILRKNNDKIIFLSFVFAGIAYTIRPMGMIMIIILLIVYVINFKKDIKPLKILLCLGIFLLVIFPVSFVRDAQFGNPLYYGDVSKGFVTETAMLNAINVESVSSDEFIENEGFEKFVQVFILSGIINSFKGVFSISLPYLIILVPAGMLLSFKTNPKIKSFILSNWIVIIFYAASLSIVSSIVLSPRFFLPLVPFLIIVSILPIYQVCSMTIKTKNYQNISLICIVSFLLALSVYYTITEYPKSDQLLENEKLEFSRYLHNNLDGNFFNAGWATHYFTYVGIVDTKTFKSYYLENENNKNSNIAWLRLYGNSIDEIVLEGEKYGLKYLVIEEKQFSLAFLDEIYDEGESYPYLTKIFDSTDADMKKLKVKVFKIDYDEFYKNTESMK